MGELHTKRVRAFNVRVGDELSFFDTIAHRERRMVVAETVAPFEGAVQLTIRSKGAGRIRYVWQMERAALVRVRRATP